MNRQGNFEYILEEVVRASAWQDVSFEGGKSASVFADILFEKNRLDGPNYCVSFDLYIEEAEIVIYALDDGSVKFLRNTVQRFQDENIVNERLISTSVQYVPPGLNRNEALWRISPIKIPKSRKKMIPLVGEAWLSPENTPLVRVKPETAHPQLVLEVRCRGDQLKPSGFEIKNKTELKKNYGSQKISAKIAAAKAAIREHLIDEAIVGGQYDSQYDQLVLARLFVEPAQ